MPLETIKRAERIATYILTLIVGVLAVILFQQYGQLSKANTDVEKLQDQVRGAYQKIYNLQEQDEDKQRAKESELQVKLWEAEQKLATCKKD